MEQKVETTSQTRQAEKKMRELRDFLDSVQPNSKFLAGVNGGKDHQLTFSSQLFRRAPETFLERTSVQTLALISADATRIYNDFISSGKTFLVKVFNPPVSDDRSGNTIIYTVIKDRPFVVDTFSELLRVNSLLPKVILHPVLEGKDKAKVSLQYAEISRIDDEVTLKGLERELSSVFQDLSFVTDDFSTLLLKAESAASSFDGLAQNTNISSNSQVVDIAEIVEFIRWLSDGGFVFLGYREWAIINNPTAVEELRSGNFRPLTVNAGSQLGIFRSDNSAYSDELLELHEDIASLVHQERLFGFTKVLVDSPIHRRAHMDVVLLRFPSLNENNKTKEDKVLCFVGLLTSKALSQEGSSVPVVRRKLRKIIELEGTPPNSHDYKRIVSVINSIPKWELLSYKTDVLHEDVTTILGIQQKAETHITLYQGSVHRFIKAMVIMSRDRFSEAVRLQVQDYLELQFGVAPLSSEYTLCNIDDGYIRIHFLLPRPSKSLSSVTVEAVEARIRALTLTWDDKLLTLLSMKHGEIIANRLLSLYSKALPEQYKAAHSPEDGAFDIEHLEALTVGNPLEIAIRHSDPSAIQRNFEVILYKRGGGLTLSSILPYLENVGLHIISETTTALSIKGTLWAALYTLQVKTRSPKRIKFELIQKNLLLGLKEIFLERFENDRLNRLLLDPGLTWQEVRILRGLQQYLWQLNLLTSESTIILALVQNPKIAKLLVNYFQIKFDPFRAEKEISSRLTSLEKIEVLFFKKLKSVPSIAQDRALRMMFNIIKSIVRTNAYQNSAKAFFAFKIDSKQIAEMPLPRPMYEIFVTNPEMEGIHLRSSRVARGGIRWSDRENDYRTEVLSLMKTQKLKNAVIIPGGAKGGFIVKKRPRDQQLLNERVVQAYSSFIRALLSVTDNVVETGAHSAPPDTIIYDEHDPYLVVAADKGTATFSDLANSIAVGDYKFWLGDAFASGGSNGYDHKKLGITARGTWQSVLRHFREMGIDPEKEEFTLVGIGDMSGDVFGNGLLLSKKAKLIAAFNHKHIFLDPDPEPAASYAERKRLFDLPRSSWSDYDEKILSAGGGIYERSLKEIKLSTQVQKALGCSDTSLSGDRLISRILKAPVDLIWNGGIGTYVKASSEDNTEVYDRTNDETRVDASQLRTKIFGEGGNLGMTQLARIEYALLGGRLNTDAIDNSGGVSLSDIEVNLKILLRSPVLRGDLSVEQRNKLLASCANDCCELVLSRNISQTGAITLGAERSRKSISSHRALINFLCSNGILDLKQEALPEDSDLLERQLKKQGLTRPEIAILFGYVKTLLSEVILKSHLPDDAYLQKFLYNYFPISLRKQFSEDILRHPLNREIIATQASNMLVERVGTTFAFVVAEETGADPADIIAAFLAADAIAEIELLVNELAVFDIPKTSALYVEALLSISKSLEPMTRWLLEKRSGKLSVLEMFNRFHLAFQKLLKHNVDFLGSSNIIPETKTSTNNSLTNSLPPSLINRITALTHAAEYLDIIEIANSTKQDELEVARFYMSISTELGIPKLLGNASLLEPVDHWEALALRTITSEIRSNLASLIKQIILEQNTLTTESLNNYRIARDTAWHRYLRSTGEFQNQPVTTPVLMVISNQLWLLSRPLF